MFFRLASLTECSRGGEKGGLHNVKPSPTWVLWFLPPKRPQPLTPGRSSKFFRALCSQRRQAFPGKAARPGEGTTRSDA